MSNKTFGQTRIEAEIRQAAKEGWTELDFHYCHFLELPKSLLEVKGLRKLSLFECEINIPAWLSELQSLEELDIGATKKVEDLLPVIHELHNLRILKMGYTDLEALPNSFGLLQNLEELILTGADFTIFPQCIGELKKLHSLTFKYCYCEPDDVFNVLAQLPNLRELRITFSYDFIKEGEKDYSVDIPPSLLKLSNLEVLDLHDFPDLQSLPEHIHKLSKLRKLDIGQDSDYDGCKLAQLPASLFDIASLEHLDITDCQHITELPQSIEHWQNPKVFRCTGSGLKTLPVFSREQLEKLEMHN